MSYRDSATVWMRQAIDRTTGRRPLRWMLALLLASAASGSALQLWFNWKAALASLERQMFAAQSILEARAREAVRHQESILRVLGENALMRRGPDGSVNGRNLIAQERRIAGFALLDTDGAVLTRTGRWEQSWNAEAARLAGEASTLDGRMAIGIPQPSQGGGVMLPIAIAVADEATGGRAVAVAAWDVRNFLGRLELDAIDRKADFWLVVLTSGQHYLLSRTGVQRIDDPQRVERWAGEIEANPGDPTETFAGAPSAEASPTHEAQHGHIQAVWSGLWPGSPKGGAGAQDAVGGVCQVEPWALSVGASLPRAVALERFRQGAGVALGWGVLMAIASVLAFRIMSRSHRAYERKLVEQASRDPLTGLGNRAQAGDHLALELARADRTGKVVATIMIDLDNFKELNDSRGHEAGDRLLVTAANALKNAVRNSDTVSRQGGDEFLVVCGDLDGEDAAQAMAERVFEALRRTIREAVAGLRISASVGVAVAPRDGSKPDDLLRKADRAMYEAKGRGKDALHFYDEQLNSKSQRRLVVERCLDGALGRKEIGLALQPQWDTRTGECIGFEALARWMSEELGEVSPAEFVPIAEDIRRINGIGAFVMREAISASVRLSAAAGCPVRASVNLSAIQLQDAKLDEHVASLLEEFGIVGQNLVLEVTESAMVKDIDEAVIRLGKLRALGIGVSVDDFGTGYSSLSYLHRLPATEIKIDRSFVRDMGHSAGARELTAAIAGIGRNLGLQVVAEGVETEAQAALLRGMGVDVLQGYLLGKPMPIEALERILQDRRRARV